MCFDSCTHSYSHACNHKQNKTQSIFKSLEISLASFLISSQPPLTPRLPPGNHCLTSITTENLCLFQNSYKWTHSIWTLFLSLSIMFFRFIHVICVTSLFLLLLKNIQFYEYSTIYPFSCRQTLIGLFPVWVIMNNLPQKFLYKSFCKHMYPFQLGPCLRMELVGHRQVYN